MSQKDIRVEIEKNDMDRARRRISAYLYELKKISEHKEGKNGKL